MTSQRCLPPLDLVPLCSLVASPRCLPTLTPATLLPGDFTALPSNAGPLSPSLSWETHVVLHFGASSGKQSSLNPYHGPPELPLSAQTWNSSPSPSNFSSITIATRLNTLNSYCLPPLPLTCSSFFYVSHLFHLNWLPASSSACCSHARPLDASTKSAELGLSRTISSTEVSIRNVCLSLPVLSHIPDYPFKLTLSYFTHFFNIIIPSLPTLLLWEHLHDHFLQAAHLLRQHPEHFGVLSHFCVVLLPDPSYSLSTSAVLASIRLFGAGVSSLPRDSTAVFPSCMGVLSFFSLSISYF